MIRSKKAVLLLVAVLGLWGCARATPRSTADSDRIKALEAKARKLEDDFRLAATTRDQLRQKLEAVESDRSLVQKQIQPLIQERDELRQQVTVRIAERDAVLSQYEAFRKDIRNLLGQADAAVTPSTVVPVTSAASATTPGKS